MLFVKCHLKNIKIVSLLLMLLVTALSLAGCGMDLKVDLSLDAVYEVKLDETLTVVPEIEKGANVGEVNVLYSVLDESIATIENGVVTPHALGQTTIRVTYKINPKVYAEAQLKVVAPTRYTITYVLGEGVNAQANPATYSMLDLPLTLAAPTRPWYTFEGWYDAETDQRITEIAVGTTGAKTVVAKWQEVVLEEFDITYNLDGGTNGANPATYTAKSLPITLENPVKEGFIFQGWYDNAEFTGEQVVTFGTETTGDKALYAKWVKAEYAIAYELNGGVNAENNPVKYSYSDTASVALAAPTKEHHTFLGWYETADFSGNALTEIAPRTIGDKTLYAKWELETFDITYVLDGGTNATANPGSYTYLSVPLTLADPTRAGYKFLGWYENANFSGEAVTSIAATATGDKTFYAKWLEIVTYNITYNVLDATWRYATKDEMLTDFLTDFYAYVQPTDDLMTFMHGAGKTSGFAGTWHSNENYKKKLYTAGAREADSSKAYFINQPQYNAKWLVFFDFLDKLITEVNSIQNLWGSTYTGFLRIKSYFTNATPFTAAQLARMPAFEPLEKTYNNVSELILPTPIRAGYVFLGWYETSDFSSPKITKIEAGTTGNKNFFGRWGVNYEITYVLDGGVNSDSNPSRYNEGDLPLVLEEPVKEGYKFLGWYETADFSGEAVSALSVGTTGAKTLYAKWDLIVNYNITYVLDGGVNHQANPATYNIYILPLTLGVPVKEGYDFKGWYETADFSGSAVTEIASTNGDKTYYAKWEEAVIDYTLTYELSGASNNDGNPSGYNRKTLPVTLVSPAKGGATFLGWYATADFTGEPVTEISVGTTGDITLYAKWDLLTFNITYQVNDGYWRYATKDEMLTDFLTDLYAYVKPTDDLMTFMHGAGKTSGFAGTWHSNTNYKNKIYKASTRTADATQPYFINQPEYNAKWLVFLDFIDRLVTEVNSAQTFWGSTYVGYMRIKSYFTNATPFSAAQLARIPDFSPAQKTYNIETETITLGIPSKKDTKFLGWYDNEQFAGRPVSVISKGSVGDKVFYARWEEKYDVNIVVNPAWVGTAAGTTVTYQDYTLTFGTDAFANLQAALDAAVEGNIILLAAGTYADPATISKNNITIIGPYANVDPNFNTRTDEAIITGVISVAANVQNLTMNGIALNGAGQVIGDVNGGIDHFVFKYNKVFESSSAITTGVLYFRVDANKNTNFYLMNNLFTGAAPTSASPRFFRGSELENLTITDNVFNQGIGQASDPIRFGGTGAEATTTGIGLAGVVNISGNQFLNVGQYGLFIRRYSATEINIINNYFENFSKASTYDSTSVINFSNFVAVAGVKTVVNINYNTFKDFKTGIRLEAAGQTADTWEAEVHYNKFIAKSVAAGLYVSDNDKSELDLIDAEYNYFDTDVTAEMFTGVKSFANVYESEAQVPVLDASGQILATEITVLNPVTSLDEYAAYQLNVQVSPEQATDKRVTFETNNEGVIKVNQLGHLEVVGIGNATITIKSVGNAAVYTSFNITVNELTHIEVTYEGTGVLQVNDVLDLAAAVNPVAAGTVIWSSSNPSIMTVDQDGIVRALAAGEAYITAKLANNETISMTVGLVAADAFTEADVLMGYLAGLNEGTVLYQNINVVGYQFIYPYDLYGSVNKYFFTSHNVNEQIVPVTNTNRPGTPMNPTLQYITIHDTASSAATATAKMHADYMTGNTDGTTSWHYTVDESSIYHHIPDLEHAWHAGDGSTIGGGNMSSIGIETCVNEGSDLYRTWQRTAKLVANLLVTHGLGVDDVRQHYDWSQKNCPQTLRNAGLWNNFMTLVQAEYDMLTKYNGYTVTFISNNTDLLDNTGRIIRTPLYSTDVTYTITVAKDGYTKSMTFHAVIPGKLSW